MKLYMHFDVLYSYLKLDFAGEKNHQENQQKYYEPTICIEPAKRIIPPYAQCRSLQILLSLQNF